MDTMITLVDPSGARSDHRFTEEPITLGSAVANHLVCDDAAIAAHQLIVFRDRGRWMLRNLGPGAPLTCAGAPVEPGASIALPAECELTVGAYSLHWYSEAPPAGMRREFAGAVEVDEAAAAEPVEAAPTPDRSGVVVSGSIDPNADHDDAPDGDEMDPELLRPRTRVLATSDPAVTVRRPTASPTSPLTRSSTSAIPSPPPLRPEASPRRSRPTRPARLPLPEEDAAAQTSSRATVAFNAFRRMRIGRVHRVVVEVVDADGLRIVPHFPGCAVTPTAARVASRGNVVFHVTPVAPGRHADGAVDLVGGDARPTRFSLPFRATTRGPVRAALGVSVAAIAGAWVALGTGWDAFGPLRQAAGDAWPASLDRAIAQAGGSPGVFAGVCVLGLVAAFVANLAARPKAVRINAQSV